MSLWIMNQDGTILTNCNDICVVDNKIIGYFDKETEYETLGEYSSKERAKEIIEDIKTIIKFKESAKLPSSNQILPLLRRNFNEKEIDYIASQMNVYEMPKE